jgi:hypothetical protein
VNATEIPAQAELGRASRAEQGCILYSFGAST